MMTWPFFIGLRYLRARRQERFVSLITLIATVGMVLGVLTLNLVLAIMTGFEEDLRDRILGFRPHLVVTDPTGDLATPDDILPRLRSVPGVIAAAPYVEGQVMLAAGGEVAGAQARGIDLAMEEVLDLGRLVKEGEVADLGRLHEAAPGEGGSGPVQLPGAIVGRDLAMILSIGVGDTVSVLSPLAMPTAVGLLPRVRRFVVVGLFESGMSEHDATVVFLPIAPAQRFFDLGRSVSGIEARTTDLDTAPSVATKVRASLGSGLRVRDWTEVHQSLFSALRLEKHVYFLVLLLIVLVAAFNIVAMLVMVVMEKRRDIAVLKSMGAKGRDVARIFHAKGLAIGLFGTVVGDLGALVLGTLMEHYQFVPLPPGVFYVDSLPVRMHLSHFVLVTAASLFISLGATIYPARHAARLDPVEVLRYD